MRRTLWPLAAFGIAVVVAVIAAGCGGTHLLAADIRRFFPAVM
jgi:hypothetical protein